MSAMPAAADPETGPGLPSATLLPLCRRALDAAETLYDAGRRAVGNKVRQDGRVSAGLLEREQFAAHALAWQATYVAALSEALVWAEGLDAEGELGSQESLMLQAGFGEYLAQLGGGMPLTQVEMARPSDLGIAHEEVQRFTANEAVRRLIAEGNTAPIRAAIAEGLAHGHFGALGGDDEMLSMMRDQFRRFAEEKVVPFAHDWHCKDELIPLEILEQLAELGVFGLTVPEEWGGLGVGKEAMCVVTEELSRGYLGVGSLGTRAEIAGELIRLGGTDAQKQKWLPGLADGSIQSTAVFTEPGTGSDLGSLKTRAVRDGDHYVVTGNKTWITHAARSDIMTLLARTGTPEEGYRGLSMFICEKPRGTDADPFPAEGMSGGEIPVIGYRGMKEYEIGFDGYRVPAANLLGEIEGQGFKQLMATFESARIQTAARAVGVAQNSLELGLGYARDRVQFGKSILGFPRVAGKLAWMAVETMMARQLTYRAAREKDSDRRCDIEAGMAKLLGARVAWANADNALQIHGGNGFAVEYPISRVLADARILNIFEGAGEIQAQVIARGLLDRRN